MTFCSANACARRPACPFRAAKDGPPMTATYGFDSTRPRSRGARIARIDALATLLDTALVIPGTGVRFGLDALIGFFPVVGDAFDVLWRANRRNVRLLMEWLEHERRW